MRWQATTPHYFYALCERVVASVSAGFELIPAVLEANSPSSCTQQQLTGAEKMQYQCSEPHGRVARPSGPGRLFPRARVMGASHSRIRLLGAARKGAVSGGGRGRQHRLRWAWRTRQRWRRERQAAARASFYPAANIQEHALTDAAIERAAL